MGLSYQIIGMTAGAFGLIGYLFYIRSLALKKKEIRPNLTSWILWSVSYVLICATYYFSGARDTIWVPLIYAIANIVILLLIFRRGYYAFTIFEKVLLFFTILSVVVWIVFRSPFMALLINMGIGAAAIVPTALKVYKKPLSEDKLAWFFFSLADLTNIAAIQNWSWHIALYPMVAALGCLITFVFLYRNQKYHI